MDTIRDKAKKLVAEYTSLQDKKLEMLLVRVMASIDAEGAIDKLETLIAATSPIANSAHKELAIKTTIEWLDNLPQDTREQAIADWQVDQIQDGATNFY